MGRLETVGPYRLEKRLAKGPFAEIFLGRHVHLTGRPVAIKVFKDTEMRTVLGRAKPVPWVDGSKYLPDLLDFQPHAETPFLATEYKKGRSLRKLLSESAPLDPPQALGLILQLVGGLRFVHHHGLVHQNLKPENLLLTSGDQLIVLDAPTGSFSVAAARRHRKRDGKKADTRVTRALRYRSGRQIRGEQIDERADIFAVGVILFELLTGKLPKAGQLPSQLEPQVGTRIDRLFSRCIARIDRRFPDVLQLGKELKRAIKDPGQTTALEAIPAEEVVEAKAAAPAPAPAVAAGVAAEFKRRFQSMEVLGQDKVMIAMHEIASERDTIDAHNIEPIIQSMEQFEQAGFTSIVFDFGGIRYISSTGFGYLVNLADSIRKRGGQVVLFGLQSKVRMILEVLGLARFFTIHESRDQARAAALQA